MVVHPSKTVLFDWVGFESNYDVILFTAISFVVSLWGLFSLGCLAMYVPSTLEPSFVLQDFHL